MNPLIGLAISLVPELLNALGDPKGGGVGGPIAERLQQKITETVLRETSTAKPDEAAKKIQDDPQLKASLQVQLAQLALEAQRDAYADAERQRQAALREAEARQAAAARSELLQAQLSNTADARLLTRDVSKTSSFVAFTPTIISYVVVVGFLVLLGLMMTGAVSKYFSDKDHKDIFQVFNILVGALAAAFATVMNFWLGSSLGSKRKDDLIESQNAANTEMQRNVVLGQTQKDGAPKLDDFSAKAGTTSQGSPSSAPPPPTPSPEPATPAKAGLVDEILPDLMRPHKQIPEGCTWSLTKSGISVDGAPAERTAGDPTTVGGIWNRYGDLCAAAARKYGVPVELIVATIATESRGDPNARRQEQHDESIGLMQTLVGTAREATGRASLRAEDLFDPATSIDAGTAYIAKQRGTTRFDPPLVAAAYNAGSLRRDDAPKNRWRLVCFPVGTGQHVDRFVSWFGDCVRLASADAWGDSSVPGFASALKRIAPRNQDPDFPPPPDFPYLKDPTSLFGTFAFRPAPEPGNPEHVDIDDQWVADNIVTVDVAHPTLGTIGIRFNRKGQGQLLALWKDWAENGLLDRIKTFDGGFSPRFMRGSNDTLSRHAWGAAFDINAKWNPLKAEPALVGEEGCVRELVTIANKHGFYWGGHFRTRQDGMHFEIAKLIQE
jgi:hypothetical protein